MKLEARILVGTIILHHLYITFLNTASMHGLPLPSRQIWTFVLVIFLGSLIYFYLKRPATTWWEKCLYIGVFLSLTGSILTIFGLSVQLISYSLLLISIGILTTAPLVIHHHKQVKLALLSIYSLEVILVIGRLFKISFIGPIIGPLVEVAIIMGIIYYNYSLGFTYEELFLVVIAAVIGWYLGDFVYSFDVPALILTTMFEQTLSVGQYSIIEGIEPKFFLSLHLAEMFNLIMVQILTRRSWRAMGIVLAGVDMTFPPLLGFRAMIILVFLRDTVKSEPKKSMETGKGEKNETDIEEMPSDHPS